MSSIPDELYYEILLSLPVKSLLICKSVCKYWYSVISNPSFINMHLSLNCGAPKNYFLSLMRNYKVNIICEYAVHLIGHETLSLVSESDQDKDDDMLFKVSSIFSSTPLADIELLCSCNGLVCLNYFRTRNKPKICLWNPATREYKKLPKAPIDQTSQRYDNFYQCALGYDYKINDYKFVALVNLFPSRTHDILVYTLGSHSWRKTQNSCSGTIGTDDRRQSGVLVNGAFHWIGTRNKYNFRPNFIISFDITSERSNDIQLPREASENGWCVRLGVLEGCLCVLDVVDNYYDHDICEHRPQAIVWVMQEYGVEESWTKHYVIKHGRVVRDCYYMRFIWFLKNGEILFSGDEHDPVRGYAFIFNPKDGNVRAPNLRGLRITNGVSYFETLVSLKSGTYIRENGEIDLSIEDEGEEEESI